MRVYRVANKDGAGPYVRDFLATYISVRLSPMYDAHWGGNHPTPSCDTPRYYMYEHDICAFSSQAQLLEWFDGFEELLDELDFYVWEFEVSEEYVHELSHQTVVNRNALTLVDSYSLV